MIMAARLRRRSGIEPDLQNWLGFGILTKGGVCLQNVSKMDVKMFLVQRT